jgi:hypothetical protein
MANNYRNIAYCVIVLSTLIRLVIAGALEFGNDEVYYWFYALKPELSHFDHPPMVGFFIQFFTANLSYNSEFCIRLAAVIPSSISMFVIYKIGRELKDELTGLFSVLLYNLSIYGFVIAGTFILPDSPLLLFWLLAFYCFFKSLPNEIDKDSKWYLLLGFLCIGLALYSKYQAAYLLLGVGVYVTVFNRVWLKEVWFYLGFIFPLIAVGLIYYWNYKNNFQSFSFHGDRVSLFSTHFKFDYFLKELAGQLLYNNPYVVAVIISAFVAIKKRKLLISNKELTLFCVFSFPLIATVFYLSLYKSTLPHWSGCSYITLLPIGGLYLSSVKNKIKGLVIGNGVFVLVLFLIVGVINKGFFVESSELVEENRLGRDDFTLDMYGWNQASEYIFKRIESDSDLKELPVVIDKWFPGSHVYYYYVYPNNKELVTLGSGKDLHKFFGYQSFAESVYKEAIYITDSKNYKNPKEIYGAVFSEVYLIEKIPVKRSGRIVKNVFIYHVKK